MKKKLRKAVTLLGLILVATFVQFHLFCSSSASSLSESTRSILVHCVDAPPLAFVPTRYDVRRDDRQVMVEGRFFYAAILYRVTAMTQKSELIGCTTDYLLFGRTP